MRLFISFDYEGLAGVTNWKETLNNKDFNLLATQQVNAFLKGFYSANPDSSVVIADSHADGCNLIYEKLIGNTELIKGYPRQFYMVQNLNGDYDAMALLGYHAPIGQPGIMDHTYSASSIFSIEINGKEVDEAYINTLVASYYNVPLVFVYGDDVSVNWIQQNISDKIDGLISKKAISRYSAQLFPYTKQLKELEIKGQDINKKSGFCFSKEDTYQCKIVLTDTNISHAVSIIPGIKKISTRLVSFSCNDALMLYRYLMTIVMVASSVKNIYR